jgi:hypothetical protein
MSIDPPKQSIDPLTLQVDRSRVNNVSIDPPEKSID